MSLCVIHDKKLADPPCGEQCGNCRVLEHARDSNNGWIEKPEHGLEVPSVSFEVRSRRMGDMMVKAIGGNR